MRRGPESRGDNAMSDPESTSPSAGAGAGAGPGRSVNRPSPRTGADDSGATESQAHPEDGASESGASSHPVPESESDKGSESADGRPANAEPSVLDADVLKVPDEPTQHRDDPMTVPDLTALALGSGATPMFDVADIFDNKPMVGMTAKVGGVFGSVIKLVFEDEPVKRVQSVIDLADDVTGLGSMITEASIPAGSISGAAFAAKLAVASNVLMLTSQWMSAFTGGGEDIWKGIKIAKAEGERGGYLDGFAAGLAGADAGWVRNELDVWERMGSSTAEIARWTGYTTKLWEGFIAANELSEQQRVAFQLEVYRFAADRGIAFSPDGDEYKTLVHGMATSLGRLALELKAGSWKVDDARAEPQEFDMEREAATQQIDMEKEANDKEAITRAPADLAEYPISEALSRDDLSYSSPTLQESDELPADTAVPHSDDGGGESRSSGTEQESTERESTERESTERESTEQESTVSYADDYEGGAAGASGSGGEEAVSYADDYEGGAAGASGSGGEEAVSYADDYEGGAAGASGSGGEEAVSYADDYEGGAAGASGSGGEEAVSYADDYEGGAAGASGSGGEEPVSSHDDDYDDEARDAGTGRQR